MYDQEKSDLAIVAEKLANKAGRPAAESVEPRAGTKGNAGRQSTLRTQGREGVSQALDRIRTAARRKKKEQFTALFHHLTIDALREAFFALRRNAAAGVDGVTWPDYEADLDLKLADLHKRVHGGAYRPQPARRQFIPKADGKMRPLAIAALEDKIVQRAAATVLEAIYEEDFFSFSYGFRPRRSQHDALDALYVGIERQKVNYILDADIRSFFDTVNREWLIRFLHHRIGDPRIIRLIQKFLAAGALENDTVTVNDTGTGQGSVISPLLANIYLHYVFDYWVNRWARREARGQMIFVRYADDIIVGFQYETDARRFLEAMRVRFEEFSLSLHPEKTRLIEFGRYAAERRAERGLGKPETFTFLGFTFICSKSSNGSFQIKRKTRSDRMQAKLREIKDELRRRMHWPIPDLGKWLKQVVTGFFAYHAVPTNGRTLTAFRYHITVLWKRALERRSHKAKILWERMGQLADDWLPKPKILHPWPEQRYAVRHPR
ncbi:MAG: group II intron reverse transcriptase/maturase [Rhodospirillaceae bacterium]